MESRAGLLRDCSVCADSSPAAQRERSPSIASSRLALDEREGPRGAAAAMQTGLHIPRKPVPTGVEVVGIEQSEDSGVSRPPEKTPEGRLKRQIYWLTPFAAIVLFVVGVGAAVGHCVFFSKLRENLVEDQTWTLRYSLALAFVFKSSLAASISLTLAQYAWLSLLRSKKGTPVLAIDAMFLSGSSLLSFLSPSLWKSATGTALMACGIWLMPFTALVAPTALTVGTSTFNTTNQSCLVPTLDWGLDRIFTHPLYARAMFNADYSDQNFQASMASERLTASVLPSGLQSSWSSPCGPNCTYSVQFTGPSWQCKQVDDVDDPRAPWKPEFSGSYWYWGQFGDGSNITVTVNNSDNLLWSPIYYAGLNASTNQFWTGFAAGFLRGLEPETGLLGHSLREILDVQAFACQIANSSYLMQVSYFNGLQNNTLQKVEPFSTLDIPAEGWAGVGEDSGIEPELMDVVGMYLPMITMLSGYINHDPRVALRVNSTLGLVRSLTTDLPIAVTYGAETPYLPRSGLGPLLEELSHNLTVSLMSDPSLLVTSNTTVPCHEMRVEVVWKVDWLPIIAAYSAGLGVALVCLGIGAYALVANGVAHDTSFSSMLRTTRNEELDHLVGPGDIAALPLSQEVGKQRLRLVDSQNISSVDGGPAETTTGFIVGN